MPPAAPRTATFFCAAAEVDKVRLNVRENILNFNFLFFVLKMRQNGKWQKPGWPVLRNHYRRRNVVTHYVIRTGNHSYSHWVRFYFIYVPNSKLGEWINRISSFANRNLSEDLLDWPANAKQKESHRCPRLIQERNLTGLDTGNWSTSNSQHGRSWLNTLVMTNTESLLL